MEETAFLLSTDAGGACKTAAPGKGGAEDATTTGAASDKEDGEDSRAACTSFTSDRLRVAEAPMVELNVSSSMALRLLPVVAAAV